MIRRRPSLLMLTAGAAAISMAAHGVSASPADAEGPEQPDSQQQTRLGSAIASDLAARDKASGERARALDLRQQVLEASEERLKQKLAAQEAERMGQAQGRGRVQKDQAGEETGTVDQLARIYQSMKPKQAASVFEQLDLDIQLAVAREMRERSTGQILAAMTPANAARLSTALAGHDARAEFPAAKQKAASGAPAPTGAAAREAGI